MRLLRTERWYAVVLGAAFAILVTVATAPPLLESWGSRAALRDALSTSGGVSIQGSVLSGSTQFDDFQQKARGAGDRLMAGYLNGPAELAGLGPMPVAAVDGGAPAAPIQLALGYASALTGHVTVLQGELPEAIATGSSPVATMPETSADRFGLRLGDSICFATAQPSEPLWCARIVALWRSTDASDPYWAQPAAGPDVYTDRSDFFSLLAARPSPRAAPRRWYWPQPAALSPAQAGGVAARIEQARRSLRSSPGLELQTSLDGTLSGYSAAHNAATLTIELLTSALVVLAGILFAVMASRLMQLQQRELTLVAVRGWPVARTRTLLLVELALVAAVALPVGVALAALVTYLPGLLFAVRPPPGLGLQDLAGSTLLPAALVIESIVVVAVLAERASHPGGARLLEPAELPREAMQPRWRTALQSLLVLPALPLLLLPRLAGAPSDQALGGQVGSFGFLIWLAGLVMLTLAAVHLVSPASGLLSRGYFGVEGTLARWQLRAWWRRHAGLGFLFVFGVAVTTFAAAGIAHVLLNEGSTSVLGAPGPSRRSVLAALWTGLTAGAALTLLAFAAEFAYACRVRGADYAALMLDGLPSRSIRRSLAVEQNHVLLLGVPIGALLGLVFWATAPGAGLGVALPAQSGGISAATSLLGVILMGVPILIGGLGVARLSQSSMSLLAPYREPNGR